MHVPYVFMESSSMRAGGSIAAPAFRLPPGWNYMRMCMWYVLVYSLSPAVSLRAAAMRRVVHLTDASLVHHIYTGYN
jgi:hypothetical protein